MSTAHAENVHAAGEEHEGMTKKKIVHILGWLLLITTIEFIIALALVPHHYMAVGIANSFYIVLTLLKAFLIVAYFMHLKFEKISLIYAIVVPVLFIIGLILVLTNESHYWIDLRHAL